MTRKGIGRDNCKEANVVIASPLSVYAVVENRFPLNLVLSLVELPLVLAGR
jgi:hypothetical protein